MLAPQAHRSLAHWSPYLSIFPSFAPPQITWILLPLVLLLASHNKPLPLHPVMCFTVLRSNSPQSKRYFSVIATQWVFCLDYGAEAPLGGAQTGCPLHQVHQFSSPPASLSLDLHKWAFDGLVASGTGLGVAGAGYYFRCPTLLCVFSALVSGCARELLTYSNSFLWSALGWINSVQLALYFLYKYSI